MQVLSAVGGRKGLKHMKIVHIESGLGNQMLSYAEYLVIRKLNPSDQCYIETITYDIPECNDVICQWNGYELERIFGIQAPNIRSCFTQKQWLEIINDVRKSEYWNNGWRYAAAITEALNHQGLKLINYLGNDEKYRLKESFLERMTNNRIGYDLKRYLRPLYEKKYIQKWNCSSKIFIQTEENVFAGQTLGLRNRDVDIGFVKEEIINSFRFPEMKDEKNLQAADQIRNCNSVAIHARRGDLLQSNGYCYQYGYFKRATKYIKKRISDPAFFFFCDTGSIEWCRSHLDIFGLDMKKDKINFINWNQGLEYYRDMQLMSICKHNIVTSSSFGWWGAYFNNNPDKITCSPSVWLNTTNHF